KIRATTDGACSYLAAFGFFIGPRRLFAANQGLTWRKLLDSESNSVRPPKVFAQLYYESLQKIARLYMDDGFHLW
ncbi:MAG: hypothetical protein IJU12_12065, partial [Clostridia bacterium]|nr:hypothetical protein [Clostridia bacterium]